MSMQPISKSLRAAVEQLRPALPALLGQDYASFSALLDVVLKEGNEDQVDDLFMQYPGVYARLQDVLVQQHDKRRLPKSSGPILSGDSNVTLPGRFLLHGDCKPGESRDLTQISARVKQGTLFYCSASRQLVELSLTPLAHPGVAYLCPQHQQPLSKIHSDNIEVQMKKGKGYRLLLHCETESHLVLTSPTDDLFSMNARGNILCPEHHRTMHRIPEAME